MLRPPLGLRVSLRTWPKQRAMHTSSPAARAPVPNAHASTSPLVHRAPQPKRQTAYGVWYREIVPAMIPIFLLSTTIFLSLSLLRTHLSHSRSLAESSERIAQLEGQLARLRTESRRRRERERKERERILPLVVERVLHRVGAIAPEKEAVEETEEDRLLV